ncbi:unnamed protein product, partial [Rangifer tarandus platyrhynchus]
MHAELVPVRRAVLDALVCFLRSNGCYLRATSRAKQASGTVLAKAQKPRENSSPGLSAACESLYSTRIRRALVAMCEDPALRGEGWIAQL